jgi:hypothetical protein
MKELLREQKAELIKQLHADGWLRRWHENRHDGQTNGHGADDDGTSEISREPVNIDPAR